MRVGLTMEFCAPFVHLLFLPLFLLPLFIYIRHSLSQKSGRIILMKKINDFDYTKLKKIW